MKTVILLKSEYTLFKKNDEVTMYKNLKELKDNFKLLYRKIESIKFFNRKYTIKGWVKSITFNENNHTFTALLRDDYKLIKNDKSNRVISNFGKWFIYILMGLLWFICWIIGSMNPEIVEDRKLNKINHEL